MTVARLISPALRSGLLIAVGSALMMVPLVAGLTPAVLVTAIAVGAIQIALGIAGTGEGGRGTLPVSAQAVYDRGLAFGLLSVAVLFAATDDRAAAALFGAAGLASLLVTVTTRYSTRPL
jgi:hypothetical protein